MTPVNRLPHRSSRCRDHPPAVVRCTGFKNLGGVLGDLAIHQRKTCALENASLIGGVPDTSNPPTSLIRRCRIEALAISGPGSGPHPR